jgi:hypothetical protein
MRSSSVPSRRLSRFLSVTRAFFIFSKTLENIGIFHAETVLSNGYRYEPAGGSARGLYVCISEFIPGSTNKILSILASTINLPIYTSKLSVSYSIHQYCVMKLVHIFTH